MGSCSLNTLPGKLTCSPYDVIAAMHRYTPEDGLVRLVGTYSGENLETSFQFKDTPSLLLSHALVLVKTRSRAPLPALNQT
ncbi:hypothetical protein BaRGS_00014999 [Batillaria attramentaria]|uniref:Uncharacterized protein n=1 Tax=Batillaria attramentaria TaxID=370345 RepID=A0ABD0L3F8_9CAEN